GVDDAEWQHDQAESGDADDERRSREEGAAPGGLQPSVVGPGMTADVVILFPSRQEAVDTARADYKLATRQYRIVDATVKCSDPLAQDRYREADWRRRKASERYRAVLSAN